MKLEYLNKHHLMREMASEDGLLRMAERSQSTIKAAFPSRSARSSTQARTFADSVNSQHTAIPYIKEVIRALEVSRYVVSHGILLILLQARTTNLHDVPALAPYLFTEALEPEYCKDAASMLASLILDPKTYGMFARQASGMQRC